jgi:hypothetical protein
MEGDSIPAKVVLRALDEEEHEEEGWTSVIRRRRKSEMKMVNDEGIMP